MAAPGCSAVSLGQQCPHLSVCPQHPYYVALLLLLVDSGLKEGVPVSNSPSRRKKKKKGKGTDRIHASSSCLFKKFEIGQQ